MNNSNGFSLIEVLVVMGIAIILLAVGVPSFQTVILNNRMDTGMNNMLKTVHMVRSEAVKRDNWVAACKKNLAANNCVTAGDWSQGWLVFVDNNRNASIDGADEILRVYEAFSDAKSTFKGSADLLSYIAFDSSGQSRKQNGNALAGTMILCDQRGYGDDARVLFINQSGSASVMKATDETSVTGC